MCKEHRSWSTQRVLSVFFIFLVDNSDCLYISFPSSVYLFPPLYSFSSPVFVSFSCIKCFVDRFYELYSAKGFILFYLNITTERERNRVQNYYKILNCANFLARKFFNNFTKLSKTKMQIAYFQQFTFYKNIKSCPK